MNKALFFMGGFVLIIVGMTMVLRDWPSVVIVFKGFSGPLLAVAGMVVLFAATLKNNNV